MRVVEKEEMKEIERQALNKYGFYESLIVEKCWNQWGHFHRENGFKK